MCSNVIVSYKILKIKETNGESKWTNFGLTSIIMKSIQLKKGKENLVFKKHPWIFSGAIQTKEDLPEAGELVRVLDYRSGFLAVGHYYPASIAARILSFADRASLPIIIMAYWYWLLPVPE